MSLFPIFNWMGKSLNSSQNTWSVSHGEAVAVAFIFSFISHLFTEYFSEETTRTLRRSQEAHHCGLVTILNIAQLEQNKTP